MKIRSSKSILSLVLFVLVSCSCKDHRSPKKEQKAETLFTLVPDLETGIDFINKVEQDNYFNCLKYTYAFNGGGVAIGDINNDQLDDVYFTANQTSNKLYLNKGDFKFEDITKSAGVSDEQGWTTGVSMIDINNDGWLDIYVCKSASLSNNEHRRNKLFINQQDGSFKEDAKSWGLDNDGFSVQSYFFDYDRDGDLDMYLVNHRVDFKNTLRIEKKENQKFYPETSDHLYRNDGFFFTNVTLPSKVINNAWGLSASIGDYNNDNWPDIYVANDYIAPDFMYINNRDGTFSNQINTRFKHISYNSMGSDYADINNDFLPDLVVLEMSAEDHIRSKENMPTMNVDGFHKIVNSGYHYPYMTNVLQLNNGNGAFSDMGQLAGISKTDWSWSPLIADFDNDGCKDLIITNGIERNFGNQDYIKEVKKNIDQNVEMTFMQVIEMMPSEKIANYAFRNNGDLTFSNTTIAWGLDQKYNSNGFAYGDLDNDGDLDIVFNNMSDKATIYRNNTTGNYITIQLKGGSQNTSGIGAKIKVVTKDNEQYQELYVSRGFQSSVSNIMNFGIGEHKKVDKIEVVWPNGVISILENVEANQRIHINFEEAKSGTPIKKKIHRILTPINPISLGITYSHKENEYNDFANQVLLPQKLSQQGPAIAVGDVNGDGLDDFFVGGAKNQKAALYIQKKRKKFEENTQEAFTKDAQYEDNGVLLFDADQDNDLDLYVSSGGYEVSDNNRMLIDRLYINDGKGNFKRSNHRLPKLKNNTKRVVTADLDKDGDLDLIIGGHVKPGMYPLASTSYILKNNNGVFEDVTQKIAPEFSEIGIVNDIICSDFDNDNDLDLIVVGDWIPITIFKNNEGTYHKVNIPSLNDTEGWWNTIKEIDIDKDGDKDYIIGNLGDNNKFHPTQEHPLHIYSKNFDANNTYDMVLSKSYKGNLVPLRGKECSSEQNPFIAEKIVTYKDFALSTMNDIYGKEELKTSYHKVAYELGSAYIINNGDNTFEFKKMPSIAQLGPTMDFEITDINNDGFLDVVGVGAIYEAEVETIRYDANNGYILLGNPTGELQPFKDVNFYVGKNSKAINKIKIGDDTCFLIGNNNDMLSIFKK